MSPNISLARIERRIWDLLVLVSEQQVTESLGEIRLRRQDIHRKLLDTSLYAAVIRFICYNRDLSEFSLVIDRVAGRSLSKNDDPSSPSSPFAGGARRVPVKGRSSSRQKAKVQSSRNTNRSTMGRQDKIQVRDMLRAQSGNELRKLMRQSDQRGVAGKFTLTLGEVRSSIEKRALGGRGIISEEVAPSLSSPSRKNPGSALTKDLAKSIKSPDLRRRLLRHAKY